MPAAYLTQADLESRISQGMVLRLLDDDNDGVADAAALDATLVAAERFVDGHVSRLYPMATILADAATLAHVRSLASAIAVHYAYQRRPEFGTREGTPYQGPFDEAVKVLDKIRKGEFRLDTNGAPVAPANVGGSLTEPQQSTIETVCPGFFTSGFGSY